MSGAKVPRAVFSYTTNNGITPPDLGDELASIITHGFLKRFDNAKHETWFRRVWLIETSLDSKRFGVSLKFLEKSDEWSLIASTLDWPVKFSLLLSHWRIECNVEQKIVCNEVHNLLLKNPHVSKLRWYFAGDHRAVVAPSDLWTHS